MLSGPKELALFILKGGIFPDMPLSLSMTCKMMQAKTTCHF